MSQSTTGRPTWGNRGPNATSPADGGAPGRRGLRASLLVVVSLLAGLVAPVLVAAPAGAATVDGTTWTLPVTGAYRATTGTVYAKSGVSLKLTATTSDAQCVKFLDGTTELATDKVPAYEYSFIAGSFGGAGDGNKKVTVTAYGNNPCTINPGTRDASYVLDNTGPTVTAALSPVPNGDGWNRSDVSVAWSAIDNSGGSGVKGGANPGSASVTAEGVTNLSSSAVDNVDNSGTGSTTVKLDKTLPTITGSRSPAANGAGWNNTDVTVSFSCDDPQPTGVATISGLSTASTCGPTTLSSNGAGQSVSGTARDNAGNSASATVGSISIDKAAPTLSGAPTTSPNGAGWYKGDVAVAWTCADQTGLSGIDGSCPANSTITGEGSGLTAAASVKDKAGNQTSASSPAVNIDRTAPATTASAPPAWNNSDVTVSLAATDALSQVDKTYYRLNGGSATVGTSVSISTEGTHSLEYWSNDRAGNEELHRTLAVKIDKTDPTISHTQSPAANDKGWNNGDVTVTFTCADADSGIAACTSPQTLSTEGRNQAVTGTARDNAGNTATDPASVSIDKTAPTITTTRSPAANAAGWNNTDVTVGFGCSDSLSGIDSCPSARTLSEGGNQTAAGTASDAAGNAATASVSGINVDKTPPALSGAPTTAPNEEGWYNGPVSVAWSCSDGLSGLAGACPDPTVLTGDGTAVCAVRSISDLAGNISTESVCVKIDGTAPVTTASAPSAWSNGPVTVTLGASDSLSEVKATYYRVGAGPVGSGTSLTVAVDGAHTVEYWSVDNAGNEEPHRSVVVKVDTQVPTITGSKTPKANANGWNNGDVTVKFSCADQAELSGLAGCTQAQTLTNETDGTDVFGTALDNAGNTNGDLVTVRIDRTPPVVTATADRAANANGWYDADVKVTFGCTDGLSGVDTCPGQATLGHGGNQTASGTGVDAAGNAAAASVTGVNVDKVAPSVSGAPTVRPNAAGWYKGDVTIAWTCGDDLSGLDGTCPATSTVTGEGEGLRQTVSVKDRAGNLAEGSSEPVNIDRTAPSTDADAPTAWTNRGVTVTLSPSDSQSGVKDTFYVLDSDPQKSGTSVSISTEGTHTLKFWSVDKADNAETAKTVQVKIDKSNPTITAGQDPAANGKGWNNTDVTVTFTCADPDSGIAFCTSPQKVTTEGKDQAVPGRATDNAGNTSTHAASVSIDKTAPTITAAANRSANANGWYDAEVTVSFTCSDTLSAVDDCTAPITLPEGRNQTASGTAVDGAGNTAGASIAGISIDRTAPTISGAPTSAPNTTGWYNGDVAVRWTCADNLSGVASCPADATIRGEGEGLTASASVSDLAGNTAAGTSSPRVNIDRTAPATGVDGAATGWASTDVTLSLLPTDAGSGPAGTWFKVDGGAVQAGTSVRLVDNGVHTVEFWSTDRAGNVESPNSIQVSIDKAAPTITAAKAPAANAAGWHNTDVTVTFTCADQAGLSGLAPAPAGCTAPTKVSTEGADQAVRGTAVDVAGNEATTVASVSLDKTAPTISAAADRDPNRHGWYADDVTVSFACDDTLAGVARCAAPVTLAQGANQTASGTASDTAGNTATASVSGINVDKTAPTLSGAPTQAPNGAGWYNGDVTIAWTCADQPGLSGIDGLCSPSSTIEGEGNSLKASTSVTDKAGNETKVDSPAVKIDRTRPSTDATGYTGWTNTGVTVNLAARDNLSGVQSTHFQVDGGSVQTGSAATISGHGIHSLRFWSVDNAGNSEAVQTLEVAIDESNPTISWSQDPAANTKGWNRTDVKVTFTCADADSGVASCTAPQAVTAEGKDQPVSGTARDNAGNTASAAASVSIDKTAPTISARRNPAANAHGWNDTDVVVSFECADQQLLSGVDGCTAPVTLGQGAGQSASGTAVDAAGNSAGASVGAVNVDKTAPSLSGTPTSEPDGAGWYNGDVTVTWSCADQPGLSGIDGPCPASSTIGGEGSSLKGSASVSDRAGNVTTADSPAVKIDRTAPVTTDNAPTGWRNGTVTVTLSATDNLSEVAATWFSLDGGSPQPGNSVTVSGNGAHTLEYWSVDRAGNIEVRQTRQVLVDTAAPTISATVSPVSPNANGWYNTAVTVSFTCADQAGLSGVVTCPSPVTVDGDGKGQEVRATVSDHAGNTTPITVGPLNVDRTKPTITIGGVESGRSYHLGKVPAATCEATDALSGIALTADGTTCSGTTTGGNADGVGGYTYTATATDKAGNVETKSVTYSVIYRYDGLLQPINDSGSGSSAEVGTTSTTSTSSTSTSVFKAGSTVPVKLQLKTDNGTVIPTASSTPQKLLAPVQLSSTSAAVNETAYSETATPGGDFRWDSTNQQYIYNLSTKGLKAGYYYRLGMTLSDGKTYTATIALK